MDVDGTRQDFTVGKRVQKLPVTTPIGDRDRGHPELLCSRGQSQRKLDATCAYRISAT